MIGSTSDWQCPWCGTFTPDRFREQHRCAPGETTLRTLPNAEALRDLLDALNEAGIRTEAAGVDAHSSPFLITLQGPYAETEAVLRGVPWDGEIDWNTPLRCDECGCREAFGIYDLAYPVRVIVGGDPE